jgi:hypothetical protein
MAAGGVTSRNVYVTAPEEDKLIRYHVGIDVGKHKHYACVCDSVEDRYTTLFPFTVDRQDFERFLIFLQQQAPVEQILVGVEVSGPYALTIGNFLLEHGYTVVEINPFQANQFRKAQGKKAKTDRVDARSLAAFLSVGSHKPLVLGEPHLENLRELTRFRVDLVNDHTSLVNRLKETIAIAFPELGAHLASLDSPAALTLLATYPGPQGLAEAGVPAVSSCLIEASHRRLGSAQAQAIVSAAGTTIGLLRRQPALALKLEVLAQGILSVNMQLQRVEAAIEELFSHLPLRQIRLPRRKYTGFDQCPGRDRRRQSFPNSQAVLVALRLVPSDLPDRRVQSGTPSHEPRGKPLHAPNDMAPSHHGGQDGSSLSRLHAAAHRRGQEEDAHYRGCCA